MYVKLFASILDSSVWHESPATVKVWITLLVMADEHGFVRGVEKALAHRAVVTQDECRRALELLEAPDLESQTQEFGGRRIERVEGGWMVLNYAKYREMRTREQVKEAARKARQRAKPKAEKQIETPPVVVAEVVPGHVPHVPTIASASASEVVSSAVPRARGTLADRFEDPDHRAAYQAYADAHRMIDGLDATLRAAATGMTSGETFPWPIIGAALVDMRAVGASFSAVVFRTFCQRLTRAPASAAVIIGTSFVANERAAARRAAITGGGT